jgi:Flp pilus assembly protein TadD
MSRAHQQVARFERYVEVDPQNATLWVSYGDALHGAGLFDRAEQAFRKSLQLSPGNTVPMARLAAVDISRQNFASAERALRELLQAGEADPALRYNLGLALYYQRRFGEAAEIFESLAHSPAGADARYHLISCLHNLARLDEAAAVAEDFLREQSSTKLRGYLALVQMDASKMPEALAHARQVLQEQPDNPDAAAVMSTHHLEMQQPDEAQRYLQSLITREPQNVRGWQGLALTALYGQKHAEAIRYLERARDCDPANTGTLTTLGWTHLTRHDYPAAERVFREGLEIDRNDAELHGGLATALVFLRRIDEAKQEIAKALGLDKRCFGAVFAQSILLKLEGRDKLAEKVLGNMLQASPREGGRTLMAGLVEFWKQRQASGRPDSLPPQDTQ